LNSRTDDFLDSKTIQDLCDEARLLSEAE